VSVHDAGIGIPAEELPHVFEQFYRATNVSGRIAGSGIGLATARQVVAQHAGRIDVESIEGQGSTFTIRLPLALDQATVGASEPSQSTGGQTANPA
jgi:signal transduction histidine kinase